MNGNCTLQAVLEKFPKFDVVEIYKVHAIVRMANFKVIRNLVSESLYEEISFYSFLGTRILSSYSKAYFASLYHCVIRRER